MLPVIDERALILVSHSREPRVGDIVAFRYEDRNLIHRYRKRIDGPEEQLLMRGDNSNSAESIPPENVVGVVVWHTSLP